MIIEVCSSKAALAQSAAERAAAILKETIAARGGARLVAATGASQFEFLDVLTRVPGIDWKRVEMFHLDEYVGMPEQHPASFRKYLRERLIDKVGLEKYHLLDGTRPAAEVMVRVGDEISRAPIDLLLAGVGENGHLAFNDPPADFATEAPYILANLDEACRRQQLGEGWFGSLDEVPRQAISMSIRQIMKARQIVVVVPDARKARAIQACFEGEVSPLAPASILQQHSNAIIYLEPESASLLTPAAIARFSSASV